LEDGIYELRDKVSQLTGISSSHYKKRFGAKRKQAKLGNPGDLALAAKVTASSVGSKKVPLAKVVSKIAEKADKGNVESTPTPGSVLPLTPNESIGSNKVKIASQFVKLA